MASLFLPLRARRAETRHLIRDETVKNKQHCSNDFEPSQSKHVLLVNTHRTNKTITHIVKLTNRGCLLFRPRMPLFYCCPRKLLQREDYSKKIFIMHTDQWRAREIFRKSIPFVPPEKLMTCFSRQYFLFKNLMHLY